MEFEALLLVTDLSPLAAGHQMAIDQALLETTTLPILRVYRWAGPCVTIGYFESLEVAQEDFPTLEITRRWTGGGSVAHANDWPYSFIVPRSHPFAAHRPIESYRLIHKALADTLSTQTMGVTLAADNAIKLSSECFANPVQFDLLRNGGKIAGAGQRRNKVGLLHQGSLQLTPNLHPQAEAFAERLATKVVPLAISPEVRHLAETIALNRYNNPHWLRSR